MTGAVDSATIGILKSVQLLIAVTITVIQLFIFSVDNLTNDDAKAFHALYTKTITLKYSANVVQNEPSTTPLNDPEKNRITLFLTVTQITEMYTK